MTGRDKSVLANLSRPIRGWRCWVLLAGGGLLAPLAGLGGWVYLQLHGSLAQLDGATPLAGLSAPVTVERDALGIPTIQGQNRLDVARATGFVHAQERFFQMDLLRRAAAGELAALFGATGLTTHGGALLANDMHLALRLPNIWYRAALIYSDGRGGNRRIDGVTLPGTPAIVAARTRGALRVRRIVTP